MADEPQGRIEEIERSLATLESQIRQQTARAQSGTRTVLVVGIILIAFLFTYLTYLTTKIKEETEPARLAETMAAVASGQIPALEASLKKQAPTVVAGLRQEVLSGIPLCREWVEGKALSLVDVFADTLEAKVDDLVNQVAVAHRAEIQPLIEAAAVPGNAAKLQEIFRDSLEDLTAPKLDEVFRDFDLSMAAFEQRLDRLLLPDQQLTPTERLAKDTITSMMILIDEAVRQPAAGAGPGRTASPPASSAPAAP